MTRDPDKNCARQKETIGIDCNNVRLTEAAGKPMLVTESGFV